MIDYRAGVWGLHVALGWTGSLAPRALTMAIPNALITFCIASLLQTNQYPPFSNDNFNKDDSSNLFETDATSKAANAVVAAFTGVMLFILYNRSRTSYSRWWEGGTLLQKTRGEWFNAYSSIMAFTSTKPELKEETNAYAHLLARLFSLLMCCGLQQVSPHRDRPFEIIDLVGIAPESMEFLNAAPDKVEVILQWIQRSMVVHAHDGILPVAPPILSRAFQEVSRGIVNLQNARKIADFPYPYPLAQISMILQLLHWAIMPVAAAFALSRGWAVLLSFVSIFVLWCLHFNALDLEFPFGTRVNDLPMNEMQQDWNNSLITLLDERATRPPIFSYDPVVHENLDIVLSDASEFYHPQTAPPLDRGIAVIKVSTSSKADGGRKPPPRKPSRVSTTSKTPPAPPGDDQDGNNDVPERVPPRPDVMPISDSGRDASDVRTLKSQEAAESTSVPVAQVTTANEQLSHNVEEFEEETSQVAVGRRQDAKEGQSMYC